MPAPPKLARSPQGGRDYFFVGVCRRKLGQSIPLGLVLFRQFHPSVGAADPVDLCLHRIGRDPVGLGPVHAGGHSAAVGIEVT